MTFMNTAILTDDEVTERLSKARNYRAFQHQMGHTPTVQSIDLVIDQLENEQTSRMQKKLAAELTKKSNMPDQYKRIELGSIDDHD